MRFTAGPSDNSWEHRLGSDTTDAAYWLNWRFALCALWILLSMAVASALIWRYEGPKRDGGEAAGQARHAALGTLYEHESWRPSLSTIHPAWLLAFRGVAFSLFLALLSANILLNGESTMYYYTEWTSSLVTAYFGLGLLLSAYGCHQFMKDKMNRISLDADHGKAPASGDEETASGHQTAKGPASRGGRSGPKVAGLAGYLFQIIYQTTAGAVLLTDVVFWFIIFPYLTAKNHDMNLLQIALHSMNALFFLVDTALNSMRFSSFRFAYFLLWTSIYVVFLWVLHACVSIWWPYQFLDLSSVYAPLWYFGMALLHVPCYAAFSLILKLKHFLLMRWFPHAYTLSDHS